jgi:death-on-curing protein
MKEPVWILPEVVVSIHQMLLAEHGGISGIRDKALLESALNRPRQQLEYTENISIFDLAAAYSFGLTRNHPFLDGNKRIALTIGALFLEINGYSLDAPEPDAVLVIEQLASAKLSEHDFSNWLRKWTKANT